MHVLILPSTFYLSKDKPNAGVFQSDLAEILIANNHQVGVIALKPLFTFGEFRNNCRLLVKSIVKFKGFTSLLKKILNQLNVIFKSHFFKLNKIGIEYEIKGNDYVIMRNLFYYGFNCKKDTDKVVVWQKSSTIFIEKYIRRFGKPDVIHAHNIAFAGIVAKEVSESYQIPFLLTEHSSEHLNNGFSHKLENIIKKYYHEIKHLNAVSPVFINQLEIKYKIPNGRIKWLPNMLDPLFENKPFEENKINSKVRFLNIGNLKPIKGQELLIKAFGEAFENNNYVELVIGGEGGARSRLVKLIGENNLNHKVKLLGSVNRQQVLEEMDKSDVFVLSSLYETFGVVLLEAQSRGLPVLTTKCGGPECIINDKNGLYVEPNSVESLKRGLIEIYKTHKNYSAIEIRKEVINQFGAGEFYNRIMSAYNDVIEDYRQEV